MRRLPADLEERVRATQIRETNDLIAFRVAFGIVSLCLVGVIFRTSVSPWLMGVWMAAACAIVFTSYKLRGWTRARLGEAADRRAILIHAGMSLVQGLFWSIPIFFFTQQGTLPQIIALWTLTSCLLASATLANHPTPLSAVLFLSSLGGSAVWMLYLRVDALLAAVVMTFVLLLFAACMRQSRHFGERLMTSDMLAEKREVVSLLLKEHDNEKGGWLWQTDAARRLTDVSPIFARMLGGVPEEIEGRSVLEVLAGPHWERGNFDASLHLLAEKLKTRSAFSDLVLPVTIAGERRWWEISASPRLDDKGVFLGFLGVGADITTQQESAERIAQLARFDMLTNLPNRLHLTEALGTAIEQMTRWKTRCGFLMIDLDRFKSVNDTLGHPVGDRLLAAVASRLRKVCTPNEICGRLGGDEFAVVIKDLPDNAYVEKLALAIIETVSQPYQVDGHTLFIGASVGSAIAPQDGRVAETLIRSADLAMYRAKDDGRGQHFAYVPTLHADAEERRLLEIALRDALEKEQLHLLYQPVVSAQTGEIMGFESLCRWTHPELGPISPVKFIPVAEEARLIGPIGNWVLNTACREAMKWPSHVRLAVNVSSEQLYDHDFLDTVVSALAQSGLAANRLELEVTESVFLREGAGATQLLDQLMKLGIRLALDDFGTGYSSLGYLSRTKFSTIKIDRTFVNGAARQQAESLAIVRAVVAMAESLGMATTAEGVETEAEYTLLRQLGCSKIQGFYFGRPMPATEALALFPPSQTAVA